MKLISSFWPKADLTSDFHAHTQSKSPSQNPESSCIGIAKRREHVAYSLKPVPLFSVAFGSPWFHNFSGLQRAFGWSIQSIIHPSSFLFAVILGIVSKFENSYRKRRDRRKDRTFQPTNRLMWHGIGKKGFPIFSTFSLQSWSVDISAIHWLCRSSADLLSETGEAPSVGLKKDILG